MPRRDRYVPQHRDSTPRVSRANRPGARLAGVAVLATGLAVSSGVLVDPPDRASALVAHQSDTGAAPVTAPAAGRPTLDRLGAHPAAPIVAADTLLHGRQDRQDRVSRSARRTSVAASRATMQDRRQDRRERRADRRADAAPADPRDVARAMLPEFGFSQTEFPCLDALWGSESGWDPTADNPTSSAYGIPQALTGGTHDDLPADYMTNPTAQIRWGLGYVRASYGTPCSAWDFKQGNGWY